MIQFISPDETVVIIIVDVIIEGVKGIINICLPSSALDGLLKLFDTKFNQAAKKGDVEHGVRTRENLMSALQETPLAMTGLLGRTEITLQELLELEVGDVIPLNNMVKDDSIEVNVEDVPWFQGSIGVKNKKYAIKVASVIK